MKLELDATIGVFPNSASYTGKVKISAESMQMRPSYEKQITIEINGTLVTVNLLQLQEACKFFAALP